MCSFVFSNEVECEFSHKYLKITVNRVYIEFEKMEYGVLVFIKLFSSYCFSKINLYSEGNCCLKIILVEKNRTRSSKNFHFLKSTVFFKVSTYVFLN